MVDPKNKDEIHVYLETVAGGAVEALFRDIVSRMVRDALDPNKEEKKKYQGGITFTMTFNKDRTQADFDFAPSYKPPSNRGVSTRVFVGKGADGRIGISEFNPKQPFLPSLQQGESVTLSVVENEPKEEAQAK